MKAIVHKANTRGYFDHGWLQTAHTFSFADYYDPERVHFGALRALNDDRIAPGTGFGMHAHRNMEIVSIPLRGGLEHRDSMGHVSVLHKGEVQVMSAGTGVHHSESNLSKDETTEFLQNSLLPPDENVEPRYDNAPIDAESYALEKRDGIGIGDAEEFDITAREDSTVLLIEVPPVE